MIEEKMRAAWIRAWLLDWQIDAVDLAVCPTCGGPMTWWKETGVCWIDDCGWQGQAGLTGRPGVVAGVSPAEMSSSIRSILQEVSCGGAPVVDLRLPRAGLRHRALHRGTGRELAGVSAGLSGLRWSC